MAQRFMYQNRLSSSAVITPLSMAQGVVGGAVPRVANGSGGVIFTGPYTGDGQRVYTVEIDLAGDVGAAKFKWRTTDTAAGVWEASGVLTALTDITLSAGVKVRFTAGAGTDFSLGDRWEATASNRFGKRFLYNLDPNQRFRTGTPSDPETVAFDLLTAQEVKAAILHLHNISSGAAVKVQAGPIPQNYACALNNTINGNIRVTRAAVLEPASLTVLCWFRTTAAPAGTRRIVTKVRDLGARPSYSLQLNGLNGIGFEIDNGVSSFIASMNTGVNDDGILHLAGGSFNGVTGDVIAYRDSVPGATAGGASITYNTNDLYMGVMDHVLGGQFFSGAEKEVRIYNRVLTAQEHVDAYAGNPPAAGLVFHLKLDEGTGTTAADSSGNGNNGTLGTGATWSTDVGSPLDETIAWRAGTMFRYLTTALKTYRYWRLRIGGDSANLDGRIEIGELYLGGYFEPADNYYFRSAPGSESALNERRITESGTPRDVLLNRMRSPELRYEAMSDAEVESLRGMFQAVKDVANERNLPLFAHLDTTDSGATLGLFHTGNDFSPVKQDEGINSLRIQLLERIT